MTNEGVRNYTPADASATLFDGGDDYAMSDADHTMPGDDYSFQAWVFRTSNLGGNWSALSIGNYACPRSAGP